MAGFCYCVILAVISCPWHPGSSQEASLRALAESSCMIQNDKGTSCRRAERLEPSL